MVSVGYGGFIPFVGLAETATDYTLFAIVLAFLLVSTIAAMKIDSIPLRVTVLLVDLALVMPLKDYGTMYCVFAILFGLAVLFRTVYDAFDRGPEV